MFHLYSTIAPKGIIDTIKQGSPLIFSLTCDLQKDNATLRQSHTIKLFPERHPAGVERQVFNAVDEHKEGKLEQRPS